MFIYPSKLWVIVRIIGQQRISALSGIGGGIHVITPKTVLFHPFENYRFL